MSKLTAVIALLGLASAATADMTFTVTYSELQNIGDSANWYNDLDNSGALGLPGGSYDQFAFATADGDFSQLDWIKVILPSGARLDSAAPASKGGAWGAWQLPAGVSLITGSDGDAAFSFSTLSATALNLFVDIDNDTALVRGAAGGGTSFAANGAKFVVSYGGAEYSAFFNGINAQSASSSVTVPVVPAPAAAVLALIGLPIIGWVKRRFA